MRQGYVHAAEGQRSSAIYPKSPSFESSSLGEQTPSLTTLVLGSLSSALTRAQSLRLGVPRQTLLPGPSRGTPIPRPSPPQQPPTVIKALLAHSSLTALGHPLTHLPGRSWGVAPPPLRRTRQRGGGEREKAHAQRAPFGPRLTWESRNSTTTFSLLHRAAISCTRPPPPQDCAFPPPQTGAPGLGEPHAARE